MNYNQTSTLYDIDQYKARYSTVTPTISLILSIVKEDMIIDHLIKQALTEDEEEK
jgi:hypothetical protein